MGFLGLGGPSGSGTSSTPSSNTAQAYIPQYQPQQDISFQQQQQNIAGLAPQALQFGQNIAADPYLVQAQTEANTVAGLGPTYGQNLLNQGSQLGNFGIQTLNTAFDPQQGLYNRQSVNNLNTQNAINAMSGVSGTPYGAGVTGQGQQNFNTNWLNQLLGRQATGLQAGGNALTQSGALGNTGLGTILSSGQAPFSSYAQNQNTELAALSASLGIPQQVLQNVLPYLNLGQAASALSGGLGNTGVNQLGSGVGGVLSALGPGSLIGGQSGLFGSGGLAGGIGSLFGGGAAAAPAGWATSDALGSLADLSAFAL
jgi:hypothetical protein